MLPPSLYGVWSTLYFVRTGRFLYPFLAVRGRWSVGWARGGVGRVSKLAPPRSYLSQTNKPYAWISYLVLFAVHWTSMLAVMGLVRAKNKRRARLVKQA